MLRKLLAETCSELQCKIISLEIINKCAVHIFLRALPTLSPNDIVSVLKRHTYKIRTKFPEIKSKLPSLWSRHYLMSTYGGNITSKMIEEYIQAQKTRYD